MKKDQLIVLESTTYPGTTQEILLPELGEGIDAVEVTDILIKKGSSIKIDDIILPNLESNVN